jgi:hypothetical protein
VRRAFLVLLVLLIGVPVLFAQDPGGPQGAPSIVLAPGNPPLTLEMCSRLADFFEWLFDLRLSPAQRALITSKLLQSWTSGDQAAIQSVVASTALLDQLQREPEEKRKQLREESWRQLLESFRQQAPGTLAHLIAGFYAEAHKADGSGGPGAQPRASGAAGSGRVPAELVGEWIARRGSGTTYVNPTTGQSSGTDSTVDSYKILADGTYEHGILMQSALYGCSTRIFGRELGAVRVQGARFTLTPQPGTLESKNSCTPSLNENKTTEFGPESYDWRIQQDQYGTALCLVRVSDSASACYYREVATR